MSLFARTRPSGATPRTPNGPQIQLRNAQVRIEGSVDAGRVRVALEESGAMIATPRNTMMGIAAGVTDLQGIGSSGNRHLRYLRASSLSGKV